MEELAAPWRGSIPKRCCREPYEDDRWVCQFPGRVLEAIFMLEQTDEVGPAEWWQQGATQS